MTTKVAAVMLTYNVEDIILRSIQRVRPYVDYILVVDGKSTDNTLREITGFADKIVLAGKDCKDFAKLRNFAQTQVSVNIDWCLHVDADELWTEQFLGRIRETIKEYPDACSFRFPRENIEEGKKQKGIDYQVRLVQRSMAVWKRKVHEIPYHRLKDRPLGIIGSPDCINLTEHTITHMQRNKDIRDNIQVRWKEIAKPKQGERH